ncbi:hypothetical protein [Nocardioides ferulae]|uniref:hypothetical protein n=1 Tax=Nocardioides ferulae TaxID=2340821 RepID=UPI000EB34843|nr:hypothetical protein [Nocardioides ferulae]
MTLQALLETMEEEGRRELADVLAEDERRAREILRAARLRAERDRLDVLTRAESTARAEAARLRATGAAAARARVLETVDAELDRIRAEAAQELQDLAGSERGASATLGLFEEAMALLPSATSCTVDPAQVDVVRRHRPELDVQAGPVGIGVVLRDAQGRAVHNTAAVRLDAAWPLLRPVLRDAVLEPPAGGHVEVDAR